jgi:hypothetical protein
MKGEKSFSITTFEAFHCRLLLDVEIIRGFCRESFHALIVMEDKHQRKKVRERHQELR